MATRNRMGRAPFVLRTLCVAVLSAAAASAGGTPAPQAGRTPAAITVRKTAPVTDATVVDRVVAANTKADHQALAKYYTDEAASEDARIDHFDQLFRAYMKLEGKQAESLQRHARALLKAARMSKQRYEELAHTHFTIALEWDE